MFRKLCYKHKIKYICEIINYVFLIKLTSDGKFTFINYLENIYLNFWQEVRECYRSPVNLSLLVTKYASCNNYSILGSIYGVM